MTARADERWERAIAAAAVILSASVAGCESASTAARNHFARAYSCPEDRVVIKPRDDIKWSTVAMHRSEEKPPPEVAADPARLAKWKKDKDDEYRPLQESFDSFDVFEGTGCDHDVLLGCKRPAKSNGPNRVICMIEPLPTGK
jgi:hypothetical protein